MSKLNPRQVNFMAAILGVSNCGQDYLFVNRRGCEKPIFTPDYIKRLYAQPIYGKEVDAITCDFVGHLCENDEMLDCFQDETRSWVKTVKKMTIAQICETWPDMRPFVEALR